jgi:hypothetical protein
MQLRMIGVGHECAVFDMNPLAAKALDQHLGHRSRGTCPRAHVRAL